MAERLFSLEEALALLPLLRELLADIQTAKRALDERGAALERVLSAAGGNGHLAAEVEKARQALTEAGERLQAAMAELEATGAELKGIDEGLVDFRSLRDGRVVYLCWRLDETTISWWHELDAGFAGRQRL